MIFCARSRINVMRENGVPLFGLLVLSKDLSEQLLLVCNQSNIDGFILIN